MELSDAGYSPEILRSAGALNFLLAVVYKHPAPPELGSYEGDGEVTYGHSFGTTGFFFEGVTLKNFLTIGQSTYWYESYPRLSLAKRIWYKAVRWSRKLKRLF